MNLKVSFLCCIICIGFNACREKKGLEKNTEELSKNGENSSRTYTNPVIDKNFPDPTVIKGHDGYFYAYGTNTSINGETINIQVAKSQDLINWEKPIDALPDMPTWSDKDFWAPHVLFDSTNETYYLYYSGESKNNDVGKCLGVATSKSPLGPFKDKGEPMLCGDGFVNIDPMAFDDPATGKKLLYWGSGFEAIKVQELADDRLSFKNGTEAKKLIGPINDDNPDNYQKLIEGAWVNKRGDYYYLYYSGDNCCGEDAHYAAMVARSKNATGPFETLAESKNRNSSVILEKNKKWNAPGHNSFFSDNADNDWIIYHAIDKKNKNKGRVMLIDKVSYIDDWPVMDKGTPSSEEKEGPKIINK